MSRPSPGEAQRVRRLVPLGALLGVLIVGLLLWGPIEQPPSYHDFADARSLGLIPQAGNVLSNLPFVIIGAWGLGAAWRRRNEVTKDRPRDIPIAVALFSGILLTGFGSAYYHWDPSDATLVWDRLPMSISFMALVAGILQDRLSERAGRRALAPLLLIGAGSVAYWAATGDLRPYVLVQFYPLIAIPLLWLQLPPLATGTRYLLLAFAGYLLAKLLEIIDAAVFSATLCAVSGHTLKHLAAAWASFELYRWWRERKLL